MLNQIYLKFEIIIEHRLNRLGGLAQILFCGRAFTCKQHVQEYQALNKYLETSEKLIYNTNLKLRNSKS